MNNQLIDIEKIQEEIAEAREHGVDISLSEALYSRVSDTNVSMKTEDIVF